MSSIRGGSGLVGQLVAEGEGWAADMIAVTKGSTVHYALVFPLSAASSHILATATEEEMSR